MPVEINVTDSDIDYAEHILLGDGKNFDVERRTFIKDFTTLDLQAVPGSGKTTALLAKFLILEKYLPLCEDKGVLILSHTNTAVDEIKEKISKHCPKLFSYPNYIGTIQSFVDYFLATPYYLQKYKKKPYRIDDEIYNEIIQNLFGKNLANFTFQEQKNARYFLNANTGLLLNYRFGIIDGEVVLTRGLNEKGMTISKPKRGKNWVDFSTTEKNRINQWLKDLKLKVLQKGVLHYDDAYFFGELYLLKFPNIKTILQERFKFVFVDEMQDMDKHQYEILECIFAHESVVYQRVGDKNQAIYNGTIKIEDIWTDRSMVLNLNGSHRLTNPIAELVNCFAINRNEGFQVIGLREGVIKPHLIVFDSDNFLNVINKFSEIIYNLTIKEELKIDATNKIKAIACRKKDNESADKISLSNYFSTFKVDDYKQNIDYSILENYLLYYDKSKYTLRAVRKNILNALIRILRLEEVVEPNGRYFTKSRLLSHLKDIDFDKYEELKLHLYQWSMACIQGNHVEVLNSIKTYIPFFLSIFGSEVQKSLPFINTQSSSMTITKEPLNEVLTNNVNYHGFNIEVTTVHSVKGQTHLATLYLEVDSHDAYESKRLHQQFKYCEIQKNAKIRVQEAAKLSYVGFSRPTDLLCVAVRKDRFDAHLHDIDRTRWQIVELY